MSAPCAAPRTKRSTAAVNGMSLDAALADARGRAHVARAPEAGQRRVRLEAEARVGAHRARVGEERMIRPRAPSA